MSEVIDAQEVEAPSNRPEDQIIKIDNVEYRFGSLPKEVQEMVIVLSRWNMQLNDKRLEVAQIDHAIKSLTTEVSKAMKAKSAANDVKPAMEIRGSE